MIFIAPPFTYTESSVIDSGTCCCITKSVNGVSANVPVQVLEFSYINSYDRVELKVLKV